VDNIYFYQLSFNDVKLNLEAIGRALGYPEGKVPGEILKLIKQEIKNSKDCCSIRGGFRIIDDIIVDPDKSRLVINQLVFDPKKIILKQLKRSTSLALFVCTVGSELEKRSRSLIKSGDPISGYIIDALASETVEKAMDNIQDKLADQMKEQGLHITNRFSPGYCGWQVSEQQKLFSLLPDGFCGIKLTSSSLMIPIKSVSGIIGIGRGVKKREYPCKICDIKDCIRRK
jgi:hypothetical protein